MDAVDLAPTPRPLVWWSHAALSDLAGRVDGAWQAWCADWGLAAGGVRAHNAVDAAVRLAPPAWQALAGARPGGWLGFGADDPARAVCTWLFGRAATRPRHGSLAGDVAAKALRTLNESFARVLACTAQDVEDGPAEERPAPGGARPPPTDARRWSGAVRLLAGVGGATGDTLLLHLSPECAADLMGASSRRPRCAPAGGLIPLEAALGGTTVQLRVALDDIRLDLASLRGLQPGDVVPLSHRLADPLPVHVAAPERAERLCLGCLGQRDGRRAVRLLRGPASSPGSSPP